MVKKRITALLILLIGVGLGLFVYKSEVSHRNLAPETEATGLAKYNFKLGLDLSGGTHIVYKADVTEVGQNDIKSSMESLRDVIERRVNVFGVSEPVVQVQNAGFTGDGEERLIVDLPGVTNVGEAVKMIGQTPVLEFRTENPKFDSTKEGSENATYDDVYTRTELTGRFLDKATLDFDQTTGEAIVSLQFDEEGAQLFEKITSENINKTVAIFLDGMPISVPMVNEAISGGKAQISGNFTAVEAKTLVGRLNSGALPVPISLISTQTIGPSLGDEATTAGINAAIIGLLAVAIFLVFWYRLPGFLAVIALSIYIVTVLSIFKIIPVTLTAAGIAGFIISIGVAVDANVLIFERMKEELRSGDDVSESISHGFKRAWHSVRDSNISSIITSLILFWFGTSLIKGFALTFLIGVLVSMISAITVTRLFLYSLNFQKRNGFINFLFGSGFTNAKSLSSSEVVSK